MIGINFQTAEGAQLKARLIARLDDLRMQNENTGLDFAATSVLRGRIAEIKSLLAGAPQQMRAMPAYDGKTRRTEA